MSYTVRVGYDEEEHVYFVLSSDIPGLNIETNSFEEFIEIAIDAAPDLVGKSISGSFIKFEREIEVAAQLSRPVSSNYSLEIKRLLSENGCRFVRHGKGSHDIWHSPISGRSFTFPHKVRKRATANGILKDAGLPKAF